MDGSNSHLEGENMACFGAKEVNIAHQVEGSQKLEAMTHEAWEELDELACSSTIMLTLVESVYFNVAEDTTNYRVWQKLCGLYEKQSAASQVY